MSGTPFHIPRDSTDVLPFAVGDVVSIHIEPESRGHGYAPCPDGTLARVLGYSGILYGKAADGAVEIADWRGPDVNPVWVNVLTADGKQYNENARRLRLVEASPARLRALASSSSAIREAASQAADAIDALPQYDVLYDELTCVVSGRCVLRADANAVAAALRAALSSSGASPTDTNPRD